MVQTSCPYDNKPKRLLLGVFVMLATAKYYARVDEWSGA